MYGITYITMFPGSIYLQNFRYLTYIPNHHHPLFPISTTLGLQTTLIQ